MSDDEIKRRLEHVIDRLDANSVAITEIDKALSLVTQDVGYLKKRVEKAEMDEAEADKLKSSRRFTLVMAVVGVLLGSGASIVTAYFTGGGNASE
jgi:hypothetical protein